MKARRVKRLWSKQEKKALKTYSRLRTKVPTIARELRRSQGAVRWKAWMMELPIGHRQRA
jgi:hypothetical protein